MFSFKHWLVNFMIVFCAVANATKILIPMDNSQSNHLKAYGVAYWVLSNDVSVDWMLNYKGGSFAFDYFKKFEEELLIRGVSYQTISSAEFQKIADQIANPDVNMDLMKLDKPPKIAVYSPKNKLPWDDAVTLVLTYAEIPYTVVYDDEILGNELSKYDWLHLHHEDFTGQYGKFYSMYRNFPWYIQQQQSYEASARKHGYQKVSHLKLATVKKIRDFCLGGGFLFAMCSATDTYDIALSAEGTDICEEMFDGDPADRNAQQKLDFNNTFAFKNFQIYLDPFTYEYSNIDSRPNNQAKKVEEKNDYFNLFQFSAKWDPVPTMLTQSHETIIKGFMGQTTAFKKSLVKSDVIIMGENKEMGEARYIHGVIGKGTWTFYGGHDPEDYEHFVGEDPTDMNLHPNSPGYRLILNNILFPAAKKKKQKT
ncbi:MAG: asparagine synthetase B [Cytophagales bacterium]